MNILVTGSTGHVGSALVRHLLAQGEHVHELTHGPLDQAIDGIDTVFLACGNVPGQVAFEMSVIDAAARAGVRRLVKLSARGAAQGSPVAFWDWHAAIEQHLAASGIPATVLQPSYYLTNLLAAADQVQRAGMLFAPAGTARVSMVDPRDVAAAAATTLLEDGHEGRTYVLTGPQAWTYAEVAERLAGATGRDIGYLDVPPEAARSAMVESGLPDFVATQIVNVFEALRRGDQEDTTEQVRLLTGGPARTLDGFLTEHAASFFSREVPTAVSR